MPRWVTCRTEKWCSGCKQEIPVGRRCYHVGHADFYCLSCGDAIEFREYDERLRELAIVRPSMSLQQQQDRERAGKFIAFFGGCC